MPDPSSADATPWFRGWVRATAADADDLDRVEADLIAHIRATHPAAEIRLQWTAEWYEGFRIQAWARGDPIPDGADIVACTASVRDDLAARRAQRDEQP